MGRSPSVSIADAADAGKAGAQPADRLLKVAEAADYLGVSVSWLYASTIPFVEIFSRRGRRYQRRELDAYVRSRSTHSLIGDGR